MLMWSVARRIGPFAMALHYLTNSCNPLLESDCIRYQEQLYVSTSYCTWYLVCILALELQQRDDTENDNDVWGNRTFLFPFLAVHTVRSSLEEQEH